MLVFHLATDDAGHPVLWAEDSTLPPQQPPKPGRPPKVPEPRKHPFAAAVETVHTALDEFSLPVSADEFEQTTLTLLFPSGRFGPEPSPKLVRDEEMDRPVDRVSPWTVPAVRVDASVLGDVLTVLTNGGPGVAAGKTVQYWQTVGTLADEFVRDGRVVPQLEERDGSFVAVWRAMPSTAEDFGRLRTLREAMPPLARGRVTEDVTTSAEDAGGWEDAAIQSAREVLVNTLDAWVDSAVRDRLTTVDSTATNGVHQQWLAALTQPNSTVDADPGELETLQAELNEWIRQADTASGGDVRLCLRLWAPEPEAGTETETAAEPESKESATTEIEAVSSDGWELEFLLQATDDPSLLVEASTVWESADATQEVLERHLDRPQETLLKELGRAASLYPALDTALDDATPTSHNLTTEEANTFLREHAEVLQQAGFGVILPAWWNEPERRLGARLTANSESSTSEKSSVGGIGVEQLCDVQWDVVLGGDRLSEDELEELAALKMPLVRVRGQWVSLREGDIENALELYNQGEESLTVAEAIQADTDLSDTDPGLPVVNQQFKGSLETLFGTELETWIEKAETPEGFDGQLRPYQQRGLGWITYLESHGFGGCLADDMGLGKTIQVLARLLDERDEGHNPEPGPTLVVAPLSVVGNWKHEAHEFAPALDVYVHHGTDRKTGDKLRDVVEAHNMIVTTYGVVRNDIDELQEIQFHRTVLDEAQNIKNTDAKRTQAIRSLSTRYRLALTGTPVQNRLSELWSIIEFCNPGLLGSQTGFRKTFSRPIERYGDETKTEQLRQLIQPFILRRSKTDETVIDDLPDKIERKEYCNLTEEQATLYKAATDELLGEVEQASEMERRGKVLKLINALKAICNHPRQYHEDGSELGGRSGKLSRLEELATEIISNGERALIFTQYTSMAELIQQYLQTELGKEVLYLHGGTPQQQRDKMVEKFQSPDGPAFFLLSLRAGGTGLTLTAANHVIHYDRWWNPAVEDQATDRTYRIGQADDVLVHKLICEGTVEEAIDQTIEQKRQLAEQVLAEGDEWLTELSDDELRDMVTLSEAIA